MIFQGVISRIKRIIRILLVDEITLIKKIESIGDVAFKFTIYGTEGSAFRQTAISGEAWQSPDDCEAPRWWENYAYAYDGNVATFAYYDDYTEIGWSKYIILTLSTPIMANKLRFYAGLMKTDAVIGIDGRKIDIDVFKNGAWVDVCEEENFTEDEWVEKSFSEGSVSKVRLRIYTPQFGEAEVAFLKELALWKTATTGGEMIPVQTDPTKFLVTTKHEDRGTVVYFSKTTTSDLYTPPTDKKGRLLSAFYYCPDDIITELRWKTGSRPILALPTLGAVGMKQDQTKHLGDANDPIEIYLSGTGTVKGWICVESE